MYYGSGRSNWSSLSIWVLGTHDDPIEPGDLFTVVGCKDYKSHAYVTYLKGSTVRISRIVSEVNQILEGMGGKYVVEVNGWGCNGR